MKDESGVAARLRFRRNRSAPPISAFRIPNSSSCLTTSPTLTLDLPAAAPSPPGALEDRAFSLLGVRITDVTRGRAMELLAQVLREKSGAARVRLFRQRPYAQPGGRR